MVSTTSEPRRTSTFPGVTTIAGSTASFMTLNGDERPDHAPSDRLGVATASPIAITARTVKAARPRRVQTSIHAPHSPDRNAGERSLIPATARSAARAASAGETPDGSSRDNSRVPRTMPGRRPAARSIVSESGASANHRIAPARCAHKAAAASSTTTASNCAGTSLPCRQPSGPASIQAATSTRPTTAATQTLSASAARFLR